MLNAARRVSASVVTSSRAYSTSASQFQLTTLPNGIRVATNPAPGYFSALGLYMHGGSRFEDPSLTGASHIMDRLAFKSTSTRTAAQMLEQLELLGGNYSCTSSREAVMYQASVFNANVENMLEILADTVRNPLITEDEVLDQQDTARYENREIWQRPDLLMPELIHQAAFVGGLGNPLLCPQDRIDQVTPEVIDTYRRKLYKPERLVAAFVSVDHGRAVDLVNKYLGDYSPKNPLPLESANTAPGVFSGGDLAIPAIEPVPGQPTFVHFNVAFEGLSLTDPDIYALSALQVLMGGGGSFSAGGPGKGMYSRLYTNVLNQFGYVESAQAFNHSYSDTGIFGITASCIPQAAPYMAEIIGQQLYMLLNTGRGALTFSEVSRAKNQLKSSILMNLESKLVELEDMGRQTLAHGSKVPVQEMVQRIEALDVEDLRRVSRRIFTKNPRPSFVYAGDREIFGDVDAVFRTYGLAQ